MKDRSTVRVAARVVETTDGKALRGNVTHHTAEGARVFTDGARADEGLPNRSSVCRSVGDGKIGWRLRYRELVAA
ncbi:MAG: hypothetical protein F4Z89_01370 [Acidimicrobiaceae bacterium]|nr:hypothetical protein [Acidimicrobiaceae bacterium]